jgi:Gas vesicle protein K
MTGDRRTHDSNLVIDRESAARSLGALVLTVVELLRELMERQAIRRVDQGDLTAVQVEQVGATLMALDERMDELCEHFHLSRDELNLDLGPLGPLLSRE